MLPAHLQALEPQCPRCLQQGQAHPVALARVDLADADRVLQGALGCPACGMEYPILDGIPILLPSLRDWVRGSLLHLVQRRDLSPALDSLIGDACGPGSAYDETRKTLATYAWDHWGHLLSTPDPHCPPGSLAALLDTLLDHAPEPADGPLLDLGCGPGASALRLSERFEERLVVGVDMNFSLLSLGARLLRGQEAEIPRRGQGLVTWWERAQLPNAQDQVALWCCDVRALPFRGQSFGGVSSLNLLDSVDPPLQHLQELSRVLAIGGSAWMASPFDWASRATPYEQWLGGHSQRAPHQGDSRSVLIGLMDRGVIPLEPTWEGQGPWTLRNSASSQTRYQCWLGVLSRRDETAR
ncbi:MAG: methyltransferase domain-containing protein [Myxococcota bacterium]|nr:methyltransferase domain-containing protein [Myxococcota bacterium]